MPIVSILYPYLDSKLNIKNIGVGWVHHTDLDMYSVENMIGLPGNMILGPKELSKIKRVILDTNQTKNEYVFLGKMNKEEAKQKHKKGQLIPIYLLLLDESQIHDLQKDIDKLNVNKGWGDGGYDRKSHDRSNRRTHSYRDDDDEDRDKYRDKDRDKDRGSDKKSRKDALYTLAKATYDLSKSKWIPTFSSTIKRGNDFVKEWIDGNVPRGEPKEQAEFITKVVNDCLNLYKHVADILYIQILNGRIPSNATDKQKLVSMLINSDITNTYLWDLVIHELKMMFRSIPRALLPALTELTEDQDKEIITPSYSEIKQPVPSSFTEEYSERLKIFGPSLQNEYLGWLIKNKQCNIRISIILFLQHMFNMEKNVKFVGRIYAEFIHNYHFFSGKYILRPGSNEQKIKDYIEDPSVDMIFIYTKLFTTFDSFYYGIHNIVSASRLFDVSYPISKKKNSGHANIIVLDKSRMTFEHFEPHMRHIGKDFSHLSYTDRKIQESRARNKKDLFESIKQWAEKLGFRPDDFVTCMTPGQRRIQKNDKLCVSWSIFYMALKMLNPTIPERYLRMTMCYRTLHWFMMFIYEKMPNIFQTCNMRSKGGYVYGWLHNTTLSETLGPLKEDTRSGVVSKIQPIPSIIRRSQKANSVPNKREIRDA